MTLLLSDPVCIHGVRVIAEHCDSLPKTDTLFVQIISPIFPTPQSSEPDHGRDPRHVKRFGVPKRAPEREKQSSLAGSEAWRTSSDRGLVESPPALSDEASTRNRMSVRLPWWKTVCIRGTDTHKTAFLSHTGPREYCCQMTCHQN